MAEKTTIARPYAQAVFDIARAGKALPRWSEMLQMAAAVAADARISDLVGNPRVTKEELAKLFLGICGDKLNPEAQNLIRLLMENDRMEVLTEIAALYEAYRADAERTVGTPHLALSPRPSH